MNRNNFNKNYLLEEFDARVWAKEFVNTVKENPSIPIDVDFMLAWFSCAIMTGYDKAKREIKSKSTS